MHVQSHANHHPLQEGPRTTGSEYNFPELTDPDQALGWGVGGQRLTLFSSCTLTSLRTFLVLGLAMMLQRRKTNTLNLQTGYSTKKKITSVQKHHTTENLRGNLLSCLEAPVTGPLTAGVRGDHLLKNLFPIPPGGSQAAARAMIRKTI